MGLQITAQFSTPQFDEGGFKWLFTCWVSTSVHRRWNSAYLDYMYSLTPSKDSVVFMYLMPVCSSNDLHQCSLLMCMIALIYWFSFCRTCFSSSYYKCFFQSLTVFFQKEFSLNPNVLSWCLHIQWLGKYESTDSLVHVEMAVTVSLLWAFPQFRRHMILYQCISDSWSLASSGLLLSWPPFIPQWWETIWKQPGSPEVTRPLVSPKTPLLLQKLPWPPCSERGFPSLAWAMPLPNRFSNATFCKSYHLLERKELSLQIMYNFYILI